MEDPLEKGMATVFLSGESHGQRSLVGHGPWDHRESDTNEVTEHEHTYTYTHTHTGASLMAQKAKTLPAMQET